MNYELKKVADNIIDAAIKAVLPDKAVIRALENKEFPGRVILVSVGKAAWQMANAASKYLGDRIDKGIVITKYGHVKGEIENVTCFEAGHPVPDDNSFKATQKVLDMVSDLKSNDTVLFLLSGGGSALFEKPQISGDELSDITNQLLSCGADIVEINTIRKRLSMVKGGRFAKICEPRTYALCGMMDVMVGSLRGLGYSVMPMIVSLIGACGLRLLWIFTFFRMEQFHTVTSLYLTYTWSWIITFSAHVICWIIVRRKLGRQWNS